jgi:hypothetical protein
LVVFLAGRRPKTATQFNSFPQPIQTHRFKRATAAKLLPFHNLNRRLGIFPTNVEGAGAAGLIEGDGEVLQW